MTRFVSGVEIRRTLNTPIVRIALVIIVLWIAFALRIAGLKDHDIWWDEGASSYLARLPLTQLIDWTARDVHPPLYFLILRGWWAVVGDGAFLLRFPSSLMGLLVIALAYRLGKAVNGYWTGVIAAFLLAISRFAVTWSQEMRMHTLAAVFATAALWAVIRMWRRDEGSGWRPWLLYVAAVVGCLYTFYLTISVLFVVNLVFIYRWLCADKTKRMSFLLYWGSAQIVAALLFLPWMLYAFPKMHGWPPEEIFSALFGIQFYLTTLTSGVTMNPGDYLPITLLIMAMLAVGSWLIWQKRRNPVSRSELLLMIVGIIVPALVVFALAAPLIPGIARPLTPRYFLPMAASYYVLMAWVVATLFRRWRWIGLLYAVVILVVAFSGLSTFFAGRLEHDDYYSLTNTLTAYQHPGDVVVLNNDKDWPLFVAKYAGSWAPVPYGQQATSEGTRLRLEPLWNKAEAIWLVTTPGAVQSDPKQVIAAWLGEKAKSTRTWQYDDHNLTVYVRTAERANTLNDLAPGFTIPANTQINLDSGAILTDTYLPLHNYETGRTLHLTLYWQKVPDSPFAIDLSGATPRHLTIDPPSAAQTGLTLQQIDIPLTADLEGGNYQLLLETGAEKSVVLGYFTLWAAHSNAIAVAPTIDHPLQVRFGDSIQLLGYNLESSTAKPGGEIKVTLYWQAKAPILKRYKVSVFVLGEAFNPKTNNPLWGQRDNEPVNWGMPTTLWPPNKIIEDTYGVTLDKDAPSGNYQLGVVLYGYVDGVRLPVVDGDGKSLGDMAVLETLTVTR